VLEHLSPFLLAVAQVGLATPEVGFGLECCLRSLVGISHQARHNQRGKKEGDHHHEMLRIVDPETEDWRSKEVSQACNGHDGKQC
jgi:hypothetical protein